VRRVLRLARTVAANTRHDLTTAIATVLTTAVALCLLGAAMLANAQIAAMKDHWYDKVEVSVFLCTDTSIGRNCTGELDAAEKKLLYDAVAALPGVQAVWYETRDEAWERFQERFAGTPVTDGVSRDALPESLRVKLVDPDNGLMVEQALADTRGVEQVQDQRKVLARFFDVLASVQAVAVAVAAGALIAAAVLIASGVRVAIAHRRREIGVMRLVGAHAGKIRRPFLAAAVLQGATGGAVAALSVLALKAWLLDAQASGTATRVVTWGTTCQIAGVVLLTGTLVAGAVAGLSLARHLRR
jgi:cell division transport system permease protein